MVLKVHMPKEMLIKMQYQDISTRMAKMKKINTIKFAKMWSNLKINSHALLVDIKLIENFRNL